MKIWVSTHDFGTYCRGQAARLSRAISSKSNCSSRSREFDPGQAPYFRGDWSWNTFYGHSPPTANTRKAVVSYKQKYVYEVLVNGLV